MMLPNDPAPEHEFEAEYGLPEALPEGEQLLWQGSPDWRVMAREAMHVRSLAVYFAVLLVWRGVTLVEGGATARQVATTVGILTALAIVALGVLTLMGWLIARTSVYTVTDRRVVMRVGVVLTITFNLPYRTIESAGLRLNKDGSGDIPLTLAGADRIAYVHLWPHVRPWQVKRTQPMLRALPQAEHVAQLMAQALAASAGQVQAAVATHAAGAPTVQAHRPTPMPERTTERPATHADHHQPLAA
ncbi:hypothetical protein BH11PSE8_BH11PSE8_29310 [soil metagenome]